MKFFQKISLVCTILTTVLILYTYVELKGCFHSRQLPTNEVLTEKDNKWHHEEEQLSPQTVTSEDEVCDTIHVVFVVVDYNDTKLVVEVMRSILFYRHSPLHFHFMSDAIAQTILETLLITWKLPSVDYSFYSVKKFKDEAWFPGNRVAVIKLMLPSILPIAVDRVVVLDTDVIVVSNIQSLWAFFRELRKKRKILALVENIHRADDSQAIYNTAVMLFDLNATRDSEWTKITTEQMRTDFAASSADQDIVNAVIKELPGLLYPLTCIWNVQFGDPKKDDGCSMHVDAYRIIHWKSLKQHTNHKYYLYFRNVHNMLMQYDAVILENIVLRCGKVDKVTNSSYQSPDLSNFCHSIEQESTLQPCTHLYFYGHAYQTKTIYDVTMVFQISADRSYMIEKLARHWKNPISVAVYATDFEAWQLMKFLESSILFKQRTNIAIHVVYKKGKFYPLNYLRNVALNASTTPYVFLTDGDFMPMFNLCSYLQKAAKKLELEIHKTALIVPAFETLEYKYNFPHNKEDLLKQIKEGLVQAFHYRYWSAGHAPTNYTKWAHARYPYSVEWAPEFEPYILVHKNVPRYDQRFMVYGWNKASHILEVKAMGYNFIVLPNAFIIHSPHPLSTSNSYYWKKQEFHNCIESIKHKFVDDLVAKYGRIATLQYTKQISRDIFVQI